MPKIIENLKLGLALFQKGKVAEAEKYFRSVLELSPNNPHALNLLGLLCVNTKRAAEAIDCLSQALEVNAQDHQACANLGLAYQQLGQLTQACHYLQRAAQLAPNPSLLNNLGNVLRESGEPCLAVKVFDQALSMQPNFAECWSNKAAALRDDDQLELALQTVDRALQLDGELPQALCIKAEILMALSHLEPALQNFAQSLARDDMQVAAWLGQATVLRDLDRQADALLTLESALKKFPCSAEVRYLRGLLYEQVVNVSAAEENYRAAITLKPSMGQAQFQLTQLKGVRCSASDIATLQSVLASAPSSQRYHLHFALSRAYEQNGDVKQAWLQLEAGNNLMAQARPYDDALTKQSLQQFSEVIAARLPDQIAGFEDTRPVFIVGMPRSGTSLLEQILSSHSLVQGLGEVSYGYDLAVQTEAMTGRRFPQSVAALASAQFSELGQTYVARFDKAVSSVRIVTDKTPLNFQYLGFLALVLPNAKFIHCHRHPLANCFSIFRLPFARSQTYAHSLEGLGCYYRHYWALMQRWKALFPGRIFNMNYEALVADAPTQISQLIDFLGLNFEPELLNFHANKRAVKTLSTSQVRQPIYPGANGNWQPYEPYLSPLKKALGSLAAIDR